MIRYQSCLQKKLENLKLELIEDILEALPRHQRKTLEEFIQNFSGHNNELQRSVEELQDELSSCDNQLALSSKKYDTAVQELKLLRKCKKDQDQRERQLFEHTNKLVEMLE